MEIQRRDFHPSHDSLGVSQKTRDSHISTRPAAVTLSALKTGEAESTGGLGKVEIQRQDSHFPTAANRLRRKVEMH